MDGGDVEGAASRLQELQHIAHLGEGGGVGREGWMGWFVNLLRRSMMRERTYEGSEWRGMRNDNIAIAIRAR